MSLLDEVRAHTAAPFGCGVVRVREALSAADSADLEHLLSARDVTARALARALAARGHRISDQTLRRHRNGDCSCEPTP